MTNKESDLNFSKQLIKGKICEHIFSRMFLQEGKFTVIPFGYENIIPEIMQYADLTNDQNLLDNVKDAPDFALISHEKNRVFLVEVKYRSHVRENELVLIAKRIKNKWQQAILFLATPTGFYFDTCDEILKHEGKINSLEETLINKHIQTEYLGLLTQFIK